LVEDRCDFLYEMEVLTLMLWLRCELNDRWLQRCKGVVLNANYYHSTTTTQIQQLLL
jgi:hypothetical protein